MQDQHMPTRKQSFAQILEVLADETQPLSAATIYGLSGLDRGQLDQLRQRWPDYPVERRRQLVRHLNEISEANFEMDFRGINYLALDDADSEVRRHAVEGLWEDESLTLMYKLIDIAKHDRSLEVRAAAAVELGRFILLGEYEAISEADAQLAQNTVLDIFHSDEDNELRRRALEAIANCGREGVREMIQEVYAHEDLKMRMSAVFAMGRTCDQVWSPEIIRELSSSEPPLQYEAARAAGHLELEEAVPHLARLIEETEDTEILEIAIWALGEIGGDQARRILQAIMARAEAEDDEEIMEAAQDALDAASLPGEFLLFDFEP